MPVNTVGARRAGVQTQGRGRAYYQNPENRDDGLYIVIPDIDCPITEMKRSY